MRATTMEHIAYNLQEAFAMIRLMTKPKPFPLAKQCACGQSYTLRAFMQLPIPTGGGQMHGLLWRQCSCGSTITVRDHHAAL